MDAPPRIVFLHSVKAAGTSFRALLTPHFTPADICPEPHDRLRDWPPELLGRYRLYAGHFRYGSVARIPGPLRIVTLLREPRARLLSTYYFHRSHRLDFIVEYAPSLLFAKQYGLADYLRLRGDKLRDEMVKQLGGGSIRRACTRLEALAGFGTVERIDASLPLLGAALGLDLTGPLPVLNATGTRTHEGPFEPFAPEPEPITPEIAGLLDALTVGDRALYAFADRLLTERLAAAASRGHGAGAAGLYHEPAAILPRGIGTGHEGHGAEHRLEPCGCRLMHAVPAPVIEESQMGIG